MCPYVTTGQRDDRHRGAIAAKPAKKGRLITPAVDFILPFD
jgi:hypothetical protein